MKKFNLKKCIKKALFSFLEEEIKQEFNFDKPFVKDYSSIMGFDMEQLVGEIRINEREFNEPYAYERALSQVREKLFEKVMEYSEIDTHELIDPYICPTLRCVRVRLMVGKVKR